MTNNWKSYVLSSKFIVLTIILFCSISLLSKKDLSFFHINSSISIFDSIIYSFNTTKSEIISLDELKVLSIYLVIIYLVIDFISSYLNEFKYLSMLRLGNSRKYIINLIISSYIISIIYFFIGYCLILILNSNFDFSLDCGLLKTQYKSFSYLKSIFHMYIINSLTLMFIINIIVLVSINTKNFKISIGVVFFILSMGVFGLTKLIPTYYMYFYRNINDLGIINYSSYIIYIIYIIILNLSIINYINNNKDCFIDYYEL